MDDARAREQVVRVEGLLEEVERLEQSPARDTAMDLVAALLELYGEGLGRIVEHVAERDAEGRLAAAFSADELVSHLLILHGLHPLPLEARVHSALEDVRPYLESHGGDVQLLSLEEGVAHLRLEGSCSGCPSSTVTLRHAIEDAIYKSAPDVAGIEAEGVEAAPKLLQIEGIQPRPSWERVDAVPEGGPALKSISGELLLLLNVEGSHYAYRPNCPTCEGSLGNAVVSGRELECSGCGRRYDLVRAGRCLDSPDVHLDPVPLLADDGGVRVAVGAGA